VTYIEVELQFMGEYVSFLKDVHSNILGLDGSAGPPIQADSPVMHSNIRPSDITFDEQTGFQETFVTGTFYTKQEEISLEGSNIMKREAAMDKLYPNIFRSNYSKLYIGFETDTLFHIYPGGKYTTEYDPTVREWYYRAKQQPGKVILMEPYIGAKDEDHIFSMSTALMYQDKVYAVVGSDIRITQISANVNNFENDSNRFVLLISNGGKILTQPDSWSVFGQGVRIYDTDVTGLDTSLWKDIQDMEIPEDEIREFKDINGTDYYYVRLLVKPNIEGELNHSHYLLYCIEKDSVYGPLDKIESKFGEVYSVIFWVVFAGSLITFSVISISIFMITKKINTQLNNIKLVLHQIVNMGLFADLAKDIDTKAIEQNHSLKELSQACMQRVSVIKQMEVEFEAFDWGDTRPRDLIIFDDWRLRCYPVNYYNKHYLPWRPELSRLAKLQIQNEV
jgi:hypothetical protein